MKRAWLGLGAMLAAAQNAPPPLSVTTREIELSVVVKDKQGRPVPGLTAADFRIFDEGAPHVPSSVRAVEAPDSAAAAPPSGVFTNRASSRAAAAGNSTIILFDSLNTLERDQSIARQEMIRFLRRLTGSERVALYQLTTRVTVRQEFTTDRGVLAAAGEALPVRGAMEVRNSIYDAADTGDDVLNQRFDQVQERLGGDATRLRAQLTCDALVTIADRLRGLPGRKNLVWISGGFPLAIGIETMGVARTQDRRTVSRELERATRVLTDANIAVYAVEARPLATDAATDASVSGRRSMLSQEVDRFLRNERLSGGERAPEDTRGQLILFAERTGGTAFFNTNDLSTAMKRATEDARVSYTLSFRPTHGDWSGRFRGLRVAVNREGLQVSARKGYFASPEQDRVPAEEQERDALTSLISPFESTGLTLNARAYLLATTSAPMVTAVVQLQPGEFELRKEGELAVGELEFVLAQEIPGRAFPLAKLEPVRVRLNAAGLAQIRREGLVVAQKSPLVEGARQIRIIVRDRFSGRIGSLHLPVERLEKPAH